MRCRQVHSHGFSLIEVVLAFGVISFALLTVMALLPLGLKSNQTSTQQTRAANLMTVVEGDLRNSYSATGKSLLYGLPTPYKPNALGQLVFNNAAGALPVNTVTYGTTSIGLDDSESAVALGAGAPPPFQVTVVFIHVPPAVAAGAAPPMAPIEARIIVDWPAVTPSELTALEAGTSGDAVAALTQPRSSGGFLESYVTFPAP